MVSMSRVCLYRHLSLGRRTYGPWGFCSQGRMPYRVWPRNSLTGYSTKLSSQSTERHSLESSSPDPLQQVQDWEPISQTTSTAEPTKLSSSVSPALNISQEVDRPPNSIPPTPSGKDTISLTTPAYLSLPYHVQRTHSNNLPVYHDIKGGGTLKTTIIRRITGDASVLREELAKLFNLEKGKSSVKNPTNHVVLKGKYRDEVIKYLRERGF